MSVLDRLQSYTTKSKASISPVFDITKPEGAFLHCVHQKGYKMYDLFYTLKPEYRLDEEEYEHLLLDEQEVYDNSIDITQEQYFALGEDEKVKYEQKVEYTELHNVLTTCGDQIINATAGSGKALMNGTKVLTDRGFIPIESLQVGDLVAGEDGMFHEVLGVFPQGLKDTYKVFFFDGTEIKCSGDHLWTVSGRTCTTLELKIGDVLPDVRTIKFPCSPEILPVRPYLLGYLLRVSDNILAIDGMILPVCATIADRLEEILLEISGVSVKRLNVGVNRSDVVALQIHDTTGELVEGLKSLGYSERCRNFIPDSYMLAGVGERYDLLEGLLDSNGGFQDGHYYFIDTDEQFLGCVSSLCKSLGCHVYRINSACIHIWSKNKTKLHSCVRNFEDYRPVDAPELTVTGIVKLGYETEMTCIKVDNPSHLFLTEGFIPTHNTTALTLKIIHDIVTGEAKTLKSIPNGTQVSVVNKMWVCTFLRSGAGDLEQTVAKWQRELGYMDTSNQIVFSTLDAEFKRCLNAMGVSTPIGSPEVLYRCLVNAINACNITRDGYNLTKEDYQIISGIVTYYRGRLDNSKYQHPSCEDYDLKPTMLDLLARQFSNNRMQEGVMDFEDIMELLYKYLYVEPNRAVQDFVANRYNFIYIDEFQDTSQMAYAILKFYGRGRLWLNRFGGDVKVVSEGGTIPDGMYTAEETLGKMVVVGDISQCLVEDSPIEVKGCESGIIPVQEVRVGDKIRSCAGAGETCYDEVINVSKRYISTRVYEVSTENHTIRGTADHRVFGWQYAKTAYTGSDASNYDYTNEITIYLIGKNKWYWDENGRRKMYDSYEKVIEDAKYNCICDNECVGAIYERALFEPVYDIDEDDNIIRQFTRDEVVQALIRGDNESVNIAVAECELQPLMLAELEEGDTLLICGSEGFSKEVVTGVKCECYGGCVYDISTKNCHNYISDGIISHNCIYSFRGSDSHILAEEFDNDFRPVISQLSVNWRCPANILNPVIPSIHMNADSASQQIVASHAGGEFKAYMFSNFKLMLKQLKEDLERDAADNIKAAILCRTNYDGMIPAFMLEADRHFNFSISDNKMTLDSPMPKSIIGMTSLFTERSTPAVERALKLLVPKKFQWSVTELIKVLKLNNKSVWDLDIDDIDYSCPYIIDFIKAVRSVLFVDGKRDKSMEMDAYKLALYYLIQNVYNNGSAYSQGACAYIEALLFLIESNNFKNVYEFLDEVEYLNDKLNGRIRKQNVAIQIATVHEFKGKECDSVYIWNDSDGVFPSSKCDVFNEEQLNEERRVHYIACTRAKKREHIYCLSSGVGMFVKEMDLNLESPQTLSVSLPKKNLVEEGEVIESL